MPKKISKKRLKEIEKLTCDIVDSWDLDALIEYARDQMEESLSTLNTKEFKKEWDDYYGVDLKELIHKSYRKFGG